jgi:hypothetical protein
MGTLYDVLERFKRVLEGLMCERLRWVSHEALSRGWQLLGRHRAQWGFSYVLKDEYGEMEFKTLEEVERAMRNLCRDRGLEPMGEYP